MHKNWEKQGVCTEDTIKEIINECSYDYYIAFQSDGFLAGTSKIPSLDRIKVDKLLEIRLFSDRGELLINRTMIGSENEFYWRIASENDFGESREHIIKYQTLDIDSEKTEEGDYGNLKLVTTGGGRFELPINKDIDRIKIISYVDYDSTDGMAYIYDNRLAGFEEKR